MYVHFHLHYRTVFGEQIGIQYIKNKEEQPEEYLLQTIDGENWTGKLLVNEKMYSHTIIQCLITVRNRRLSGENQDS